MKFSSRGMMRIKMPEMRATIGVMWAMVRVMGGSCENQLSARRQVPTRPAPDQAIIRPYRSPGRGFRPASIVVRLREVQMQRLFQRTAEHKNGEDERHAHENDTPLGDAAGHPDASRQPGTGRRGQSMNALAVDVADDHAGAQKADAGQDALNDPADGIDVAAARDRHDGQRRAEP